MFEQILADIAGRKIRGGINVARWGLLAFSLKKKELDEKCSFISTYINSLNKAKIALLEARPDDVALRNLLNVVYNKDAVRKIKSLRNIKSELEIGISRWQNNLDTALIRVASIGAAKIKKGMRVHVHGHSDMVEAILEESQKFVKFNVSLTDVNFPLHEFVGRLNKMKIKNSSFPFSGVGSALDGSDIALLGCEGVDRSGNAYVPLGGRVIVDLAKKYGVKVFLCTTTLKLSSKSKEDILDVNLTKAFGAKMVVPEFERVALGEFTGVICEDGIIEGFEFLNTAKGRF